MQGFPLKLPYNCNEYMYMQIDLSEDHRSDILHRNINARCHQTVLSSSFSVHNSGSRSSATKGRKGHLLAWEELGDCGHSEKTAMIMRVMKYFRIIPLTGWCLLFLSVNNHCPLLVTVTSDCGKVSLQKPRHYSLIKWKAEQLTLLNHFMSWARCMKCSHFQCFTHLDNISNTQPEEKTRKQQSSATVTSFL